MSKDRSWDRSLSFTGRPIEPSPVPGGGASDAMLIDAANPALFIDAAAPGLRGAYRSCGGFSISPTTAPIMSRRSLFISDVPNSGGT
jgi:hypothetical protein